MTPEPSSYVPLRFGSVRLDRFGPTRLKGREARSFLGVDTETYQGKAVLIADSEGNYVEPSSLEDIGEFLLHRRNRGKNGTFYNLRYDIQAILRFLPLDSLKEIYKEGQTEYQGYKMRYIPKKVFSIRRKRHSLRCYDVSQFYFMSLEKAGQKYLGEGKSDDGIDRVRIGTEKGYYERHREDIVKYCIQDAKLTKRLTNYLQTELSSSLDFTPRAYVSKAGLSKEYFRIHCDIPNIKDIPRPVSKYAMESYAGGRFEVLKRGYFKKCYSIDINSAYPSVIRNLIDVTGPGWSHVYEPGEKAVYGFYRVLVSLSDNNLAPIPFRNTQKMIFYPDGSFRTTITLSEYRAYRDVCDIRVRDGYEFTPETVRYPFREVIDTLYSKKSEATKKDFRYGLYKIFMNSIYGSFFEKYTQDKKWCGGKLFNPVYASIITADTRVKMYEVMKQNPDKLIGAATDGILSLKKLKCPISKKMGEWEEKKCKEMVVLRSGIYRHNGVIKSRGIQMQGGCMTPYGRFDNIITYMDRMDHKSLYPTITKRPLQLGEYLAIINTQPDAILNNFVIKKYTISVEKENKRIWFDRPKRGRDLFESQFESMPISL